MRYSNGRPNVYLNLCGRLNLTTGKNMHFNIIQDWNYKLEDGPYLTLMEVRGGGTMVIGGWGGVGNEGDRVELIHSQTHAFRGTATVGQTFPATEKGLAQIRHELDAKSVLFATLD